MNNDVRATYYAIRRAYRTVSSSKSLMGNTDAFRISAQLLSAGRAFTGAWDPFPRKAARNDRWTEGQHVYKPGTRKYVCWRPNTFRSCTAFLARCA